jgi:hypothetical protein
MTPDSEPTSRSISLRRDQGLAVRGNSLVTRGLRDMSASLSTFQSIDQTIQWPSVVETTAEWPLIHPGPRRAWRPDVAGPLSVPLLPSDRELTWQMYLERFGARLQWMAKEETDRLRWIAEREIDPMLEELRCEWVRKDMPKDFAQITLSQSFHDVLMAKYGLSERAFPQHVHSLPSAVEEIEEIADIWDFLINNFLPLEGEWPLKHPWPRRAWRPPAAGPLAVPLLPSDKSLTWDQYLDRLGARVAWMCESVDDPKEMLEEMWRDRVGSSEPPLPKRMDLVPHEPNFQNLLMGKYGVSEAMFPTPVQSDPDAVWQVREMSDLWAWLAEFLPSGEG